MTVLDLSQRNWDATPKRHIVTTAHRLRHDPAVNLLLDRAQLAQSFVYDATVEHLECHGPLPIMARLGTGDCIHHWITRRREASGEWKAIPVAIARGAANAALLAWHAKDAKEQAKAGTIVEECRVEDEVRTGVRPHPNKFEDEEERAKHEPSPRLVRLWTKEPRPNQRRGDTRPALRLLEPCTQVYERVLDPNTGLHERKPVSGLRHVPGLGRVEVLPQDAIPLDADVRSCHIVETTRPDTPVVKRRYTLKVQCGHEAPETKPGASLGIDYGIRQTVTTGEGAVLRRPDTSALEEEASAVRARAKAFCKPGSRRQRQLYANARAIGQRVGRKHDNWERETARALCAGTAMLAREDLRLRNMMASGAGTTSAPGSQAKSGLNRELNRARIGYLDRRIERRCVKTGTDTVAVHPGNTSITCPTCGAKDAKSRDGAVFQCTGCGHTADADENAAINIERRGRNTFEGWRQRAATRAGGRGGSSRQDAKEAAGPGQRAGAARGAPRQASQRACPLTQNTLGCGPDPPAVNPRI